MAFTYQYAMEDYGLLFQLILVAFALVIVGVVFIVYLLILSMRKNRRERDIAISVTSTLDTVWKKRVNEQDSADSSAAHSHSV